MITSIEIRNIMSVLHSKVSFEKGKYSFSPEYTLNDTIANPIAIYGKNGSGKTSFLSAFLYLANLFNNEVDKLGIFIPNFSSKIDKNTKSSIKLEFELQNNNYSYYIEMEARGITSEILVMNNKILIERDFNSYVYDRIKKEIDSKYFPALRDICGNTIQESSVQVAYEFISNITYVGADKHFFFAKCLHNMYYLDAIVDKSEEVKKVLKSYNDFPLYDVKSKMNTRTGKKDYYASIKTNTGTFNLIYDFVSTGMQNQSLLLTILLSMPKGSVFIIDELEDALHPMTIKHFIDVAVQKGIQLIFVSQNTNVLTVLRPDNVVFANWKDGQSTYKRLCNIYPNIREVNNIEKMYLSYTFDEEIEK